MAQSQYCTTAQLQLLGISPAAYTRFETASPGCTTAALQAASSIADTYLPAQFTLPLQANGWDMSLSMNVAWIAAWLLFNQFGFNPAAPVDDLIVQRYKAAIAWLEQIRDKKIFPQYVDSAASHATDEAGDFVISDDPIGFTSRGVFADDDDGDFWF